MRSFLFALVLLLIHSVSNAQQGLSISGRVQTENGASPEGGVVKILQTSYVVPISANGEYSFSNLKNGTYILQVNAVGFETATSTVTLNGASQQQHFSLTPGYSQLGEVMISSNRAKETLGHTPVSVTVLNAREIAVQSSINPNLSNMLTWTVPGLGFANNTTSNVGQTLRGRNLLVLVDGIPQSTPLRAGSRDIRTIDPAVIERIEVVKGSTSIYGNGADGGLINYITKKPVAGKTIGSTTTIGLSGNLVGIQNTLGNRFSQQVYGQVKNFDYIVSGLLDETGVFKDAGGKVISPNYGLGETKSYNAFAKLGYNLQPSQRLEFMYNYFSSRQRSDYVPQAGRYGESPAIGVEGEVLGADQGTRYNHNANLAYTLKGLPANSELAVNAYIQKFKTIYGFDDFFYGGGQSVLQSDKKGVRANLVTPFQVGLPQLEGSLNYGVDALNDVTSQPLVDGRVWAPKMDMKNLAPYAQLHATLLQDLVFKGGLRYENIAIAVKDFNTLATGPNNAGSIAVKGGDLNYNALTFNGGLRYIHYNFFKPYVSYSQGFSIFELGRILRAAKENTIQQLNLKPVIVNNYEAGFNTDLQRFNFEAVYYVSTSKLGANLVERDGVFEAQRAAERIEGYEIGGSYQAFPWATLGASYAYVEGKIDANNDGDASDAEDRYLNTMRIAPPKATAFLKLKPFSPLDVRLDYVASGARDRFQPGASGRYARGEGKVTGFNLFNLSAAYRLNPVARLNLGVENLFNTRYYNPIAEFYGTDIEYTRGNGLRYNLSLTVSL
ncbi:MAG: TonB-dependent receptor [Adhaeribacter sp.]